jgi:hypothetical protein
LEILLIGNPRQLPTERYGRTSFETYRDDFVISGYFHKVSGAKGSKSVSKAPTNSNITSFVSSIFGKLISTH